MSLHILVCSDKAIMAAGVSALLRQYDSDIRVESSAREALSITLETAPDVLLVVAPVLTIDDKDELAELARHTKVVLLATCESVQRAFEALQVGVRAVLSVESSVEELVHIIRTVVRVDVMVVPEIARGCLGQFPSPSASARGRSAADTLTGREAEVLLLLAEGRSNAEIARELSISNATVRTHVHHILRKLGAGSRAQAVAIAYKSRLVGDMGTVLGRS
ncbi:response regulator transcription factor [Streptomyces oceani]|uniref:LuxR family transcriptional regulator n=1 Tax=Streptomyces oceani TaxID=1075402 RepID=A0A1E7KEX1_9ACTN|nr:response regulator transcription factor [Streptomyces oceani]OEV02434.1 hypothetical protein AN216_16230 [Streptomyces oceani]